MFLRVNDLDVHVQIKGPQGAPALLLIHSLGTNLHVWDPQAEALSDRFRVIQVDMRGHGLTTVTPGPYTIAGLAQDHLALLDALGVEKAHVAGLSIGGFIAQSMAHQAPGKVASLILSDTALIVPPPEGWTARAEAVRKGGQEALVDMVMPRWVTAPFLSSPEGMGVRAMFLRTAPEGYAAACEALGAADLTADAAKIKVPTLVMVGEHDFATPLTMAQALADAIDGAKLFVIPGASHISTVESPGPIVQAMRDFLT